jgi:hypothetical protein
VTGWTPVHTPCTVSVEQSTVRHAHDIPRGRNASLSSDDTDRHRGIHSGLRNIRILKHYQRTLPSEFTSDILHITSGSHLLNFFPRGNRANKRQFPDLHVFRKRRSCRGPHSGHNLHHSRWEQSRLLDQLCKENHSQRRLFRRLQDHGVAGGQGGGDLRAPEEERGVPGDDGGADAVGLLQNQIQASGRSQTGFSVEVHANSRGVFTQWLCKSL